MKWRQNRPLKSLLSCQIKGLYIINVNFEYFPSLCFDLGWAIEQWIQEHQLLTGFVAPLEIIYFSKFPQAKIAWEFRLNKKQLESNLDEMGQVLTIIITSLDPFHCDRTDAVIHLSF